MDIVAKTISRLIVDYFRSPQRIVCVKYYPLVVCWDHLCGVRRIGDAGFRTPLSFGGISCNEVLVGCRGSSSGQAQLKLSKRLPNLNLCYGLALLIKDTFPIRLLECIQFF